MNFDETARAAELLSSVAAASGLLGFFAGVILGWGLSAVRYPASDPPGETGRREE